MFEDDYRNAVDKIHPTQEAKNRTADAISEAGVSKRGAKASKRGGFGVRRALAAALVACMIAAVPVSLAIIQKNNNMLNKLTNHTAWNLSLPSEYTEGQISDYSAVFNRISSNATRYNGALIGGDIIYYSNNLFYGMAEKLGVATNEQAPAPNAPSYDTPDNAQSNDGASNEGTPDHSETNTQVEGVDEADIVKTDGRYIYALNLNGVTIFTADGANSVRVGFISADDMPTHSDNAQVNMTDMYLYGDRLIVIATECENIIYYNDGVLGFDGYRYYESNTITTVYVFDVADVSDAKLLSTLCQDGSYSDSRLVNGQLYVISSYSPVGIIEEDDIATYVPCTYDGNGNGDITDANDIYLMTSDGDTFNNESYTYITKLDIAAPQAFADNFAVLGYTNTVYCSTDNLILAHWQYHNETETVSENTEKWRSYCDTELYRISLDGSDLAIAASGVVSGELLNQFSLDEYNGYLRVVTTRDEYCYTTYTSGETVAQTSESSISDNTLYVLDAGLNIVGSIKNVAQDERVYSVRFMGDVGYFVTFRQTDPLFSVDLSNPNNPTILGELKIPGFSQYLQAWGSDMLFGFGMAADENGSTECLKLSLFNVSDPSNVTEADCLKLTDYYWSEASYNHKAILVDYEKGLIGFPAENGYALYTCGAEGGFEKAAMVKFTQTDDAWYWYGGDLRGLYAGDYYYVLDCSGGHMAVIDLNTYELVASITFNN